MHLKHWLEHSRLNTVITAIEINPIDIDTLFQYFENFAWELNIPLYYWNLGYEKLQKVELLEDKTAKLTPSLEINREVEPNFLLKFILQSEQIPPGIYLLDDLCNFEELEPEVIREREALITNLHRKYGSGDRSIYIVLLGEYLQFGSRLAARIPTFKIPLPDRARVETLARTYLGEKELDWHKLVTALQGLPYGEIELILPTYSQTDAEQLVEKILDHKISRWRGLGLEFFASPDVKSAGGNDLLQKYLYEVVVKLNESGAKQYNLRPPKGMLLMGPPGTGKSLIAKLAAFALGYPLLGLSWGNVLGANNPDLALAQILEVADCLDNCVILADDLIILL
ncbi:MAG: ATP-binding protein [Xenococcaceae cyanobacterium MO_188.B32]|nr:ATP-binding protein [Xenococcaceae cyanobacterium MO_188.B32]